MNRIKIVIVGGGSVAWTPRVVKDMMLTDSLNRAEYVLYDLDKRASDLTKALLDKLAGQLGIKPKIVSTDQRARAFRGADYFVITISTGGLNAMARDLAIPEKYGIYHTVGDTSGPGGWARLMRNFDVFKQLAHDINRYAPGAMILNYTNPMATLTDVLARLCHGPVVGLCHGLFENLGLLKQLYKLESEDDLAVNYAGLNHFFWITQATAGGVDLIADLARKLRRRSFTDLMRKAQGDPMGFKSHREFATELFHLTGVMPYLGDRHTCEFFPWLITSRANMKKYRLIRTSIEDRKQMFRSARKRIVSMLKGELDKGLMIRSRESAADLINAHSQGKVFVDVGNLPNIGQVSNLPTGVVVETAVRVDGNGFSPITFGALPDVVRPLLEPYAASYQLAVDACIEGNTAKALQALRLDPVCAHLRTDQVNDLGRRLLAAHRKFITWA
jgi:alpha-galactosidase/6-phospho-beta-glucosidase family protein